MLIGCGEKEKEYWVVCRTDQARSRLAFDENDLNKNDLNKNDF